MNKDPKSEQEIFPCAHCGYKGYLGKMKNGQYIVYCDAFSCGIKTSGWDTDLEAIESWNCRAFPPVSEILALTEKVKQLEGALRNMLKSQDCEWENKNMGHDWREACNDARTALGGASNG